MGWTGDFASKKAAVEYIMGMLKCDSRVTVLDFHSATGGLYVAAKLTTAPQGIILVFMFQGGSRGWCYKDLSEDMGPCAWDCPLRLLDLVPGDGSEGSQDWRKRVREFHAAKGKRFDIGQLVVVYGKRYKVLGMATARSYRIQSEDDGKIYRSTPARMHAV